VTVLRGDCVELMRGMPDCSVDSIVTDPPYGLEFMGKGWDKLETDAWRTGGGFSKPGIGERETAWPSFGTGDTANATCATCGGRMRGAKKCECDSPEWRVKGKPLGQAGVDSKQAQARGMQAWHEAWAREALRVLKPGGHLLAFGGTRTYHRMACAIEDAGFEIRDSIHWVYGSGFPKSLNVGKAIDKAAGAKREVVGERKQRGRPKAHDDEFQKNTSNSPVELLTAPATDEARRWEGWGTALKPAHEPIVVARKPLSGTVAGNVLVWGTGGLNIDGCRVPTAEWDAQEMERANSKGSARFKATASTDNTFGRPTPSGALDTRQGRWPANVVFDRTAGEALDQQSGEASYNPKGVFGKQQDDQRTDTPAAFAVRKAGDGVFGYGDRGGASRFFTQADFGPDDWPFVYQAKPSRRERNAGLDGLPEKPPAFGNDSGDGLGRGISNTRQDEPRANHHPTVKPVALMRHLVRLVTPPGGTVLDPFAGSGTTLVAAILEGMVPLGCEMTDEYLPIIEGRMAWAREQVAEPDQPTLL